MGNWHSTNFDDLEKRMEREAQRKRENFMRNEEEKARTWIRGSLGRMQRKMESGDSSFRCLKMFDLTCEQRDRLVEEFTSKNPTVARYFHPTDDCETIWIQTSFEKVELTPKQIADQHKKMDLSNFIHEGNCAYGGRD